MAEPTVGSSALARRQEVLADDVALCLACRRSRTKSRAHRLPDLESGLLRNGDGCLLAIEWLAPHEGEQGSTQIIGIGFKGLLDVLIGSVIAKDGSQHVIGSHIYCLGLNPFGSRAVERAVTEQRRRFGTPRVIVHQPVYGFATKITIELSVGARALAELVCAQAGTMWDMRAGKGETRGGSRRSEWRGIGGFGAGEGRGHDAEARRRVDGARRVADGGGRAVCLPGRGGSAADDGMATRWWRARGAASVAEAPQAVEQGVLQRLPREAGLVAQQLLELVRFVLVVQGIVLQDGQGGLVDVVGDHRQGGDMQAATAAAVVVVQRCGGRVGAVAVVLSGRVTGGWEAGGRAY